MWYLGEVGLEGIERRKEGVVVYMGILDLFR